MRDLYNNLHRLFNSTKRFHFPFEDELDQIPLNGIYIMFEKGEKHGELDRITRTGSHTGFGQLRSRLDQHFLNENKNRSIFRKNIGRCLLNRTQNPYLERWEMDTTSRLEKDKNLHLIDKDFELFLEKKISRYIQENISFTVVKVEDKNDRLFWEGRIIASLASYPFIQPSENWLGNHSPKEKIRKYGLWQEQHLFGVPLREEEFIDLQNLVSRPK